MARRLALALAFALGGGCFTDSGGTGGEATSSADAGSDSAGACEPGAVTCPCYGNMTCDAGLVCQPDVALCIPESCTPGQTSCTCDAGMCGEGLSCADGVCVPSMGGSSGDDGVLTGDAATSNGDGTAGDECLTNVLDARGRCARMVFVTSSSLPGNFGGSTAADDECNALADAAGLPGEYRAYVDGTDSAADHVRLTDGAYAFVLPPLEAPTLIANDATAFTDSGLLHPISYTEHGMALSDEVPCGRDDAAWTGLGGLDCGSWTSDVGDGVAGNIFAAEIGQWDQGCPVTFCNATARLYCFQVPEP